MVYVCCRLKPSLGGSHLVSMVRYIFEMGGVAETPMSLLLLKINVGLCMTFDLP